jgi:hypothetical protein
MKKFTIIAVVFILMSVAAVAEENAIIDFATLIDDYQGQNQATLMDFSDQAGPNYTDAQKAEMVTSLYITNWAARLCSSSSNVERDSMTMIRPVVVGGNASQFPNELVMGVRIHFPTGNFNSYATITPPFQIPAYATSETEEGAEKGAQFEGYGVLKNVGPIKEINVWAYGLNYPMALYVVLRDENEVKTMYMMGYLEFEGWKELNWTNPNYITDVRNRELRREPLYPQNNPSITFDSFVIYRDAMIAGGDFITYIKDVVITYDNAVMVGMEDDIVHEEIWGILEDREEERRSYEARRLGDLQVLRYIEEQKMHQDDELDVSGDQQ